MKLYSTVFAEARAEQEIERSKFITTVRPVNTREEAEEFFAEVRKEFKDATHNVPAMVIGDKMQIQWASDDGEPQGTSGAPIVQMLVREGITNTALVVTRYFGGIKLGAGGLVRAYSGSVAQNLAEAKKVCYDRCAEGTYTVGYPLAEACTRYFSAHDCSISNTQYGSDVAFTVAVRASDEAAFDAGLVNALNGRVTISPKRYYFFPFEI